MPREQINYPKDPNLITESGATINVPHGGLQQMDPALHVNWLADPDGGGHVQVGFEADLAYFQLCFNNPNGEPGRSYAYSPVLNRNELNRFIRMLKRARDAAYGRDE